MGITQAVEGQIEETAKKELNFLCLPDLEHQSYMVLGLEVTSLTLS